jgi:hypothetical protein
VQKKVWKKEKRLGRAGIVRDGKKKKDLTEPALLEMDDYAACAADAAREVVERWLPNS